MDYIDIVFDGPPSPQSPRYVQVEDSRGKSINFGKWVAKTPLPILRHAQFEFPDPGHQRPPVIPGSVSLPARSALPFRRSQCLVHLRFQHLLDHLLYERPQEIILLRYNLFPVDLLRAILLSGHLVLSFPSAHNGILKGLA